MAAQMRPLGGTLHALRRLQDARPALRPKSVVLFGMPAVTQPALAAVESVWPHLAAGDGDGAPEQPAGILQVSPLDRGSTSALKAAEADVVGIGGGGRRACFAAADATCCGLPPNRVRLKRGLHAQRRLTLSPSRQWWPSTCSARASARRPTTVRLPRLLRISEQNKCSPGAARLAKGPSRVSNSFRYQEGEYADAPTAEQQSEQNWSSRLDDAAKGSRIERKKAVHRSKTEATRRRVSRILWGASHKAFVAVERGSPEGSQAVLDLRRRVLGLREKDTAQDEPELAEGEEVWPPPKPDWRQGELGGTPQVLAPCPHSVECPLDKTWKGGEATGARKNGTWCHFAERVPIPKPMRHRARARGVTLPSDRPVRLSYVVIERDHSDAASEAEHARITQAPLKRSGHVVMDACMPEGGPLQRFVVAKSHGDGYKVARKSKWGDTFPAEHVPAPKS